MENTAHSLSGRQHTWPKRTMQGSIVAVLMSRPAIRSANRYFPLLFCLLGFGELTVDPHLLWLWEQNLWSCVTVEVWVSGKKVESLGERFWRTINGQHWPRAFWWCLINRLWSIVGLVELQSGVANNIPVNRVSLHINETKKEISNEYGNSDTSIWILMELLVLWRIRDQWNYLRELTNNICSRQLRFYHIRRIDLYAMAATIPTEGTLQNEVFGGAMTILTIFL